MELNSRKAVTCQRQAGLRDPPIGTGVIALHYIQSSPLSVPPQRVDPPAESRCRKVAPCMCHRL
eukprot:CAMPEP_0206270092 /NCGR_PEP_ID=MMETSP0047_2-20121206/32682_1 /ASSEMBLY_ACC=CAM_ASM_000192 /TAXON_ID=195065 /ORGANISM="Chroomonas mesostigmatica_cf, Strain CCMP1168" /LENGTH=63 /DNA_ID=CAMNT_0053698707 /DNA_START=151 /DNA_END=339 /DNA_ORIENTATION=-